MGNFSYLKQCMFLYLLLTLSIIRIFNIISWYKINLIVKFLLLQYSSIKIILIIVIKLCFWIISIRLLKSFRKWCYLSFHNYSTRKLATANIIFQFFSITYINNIFRLAEDDWKTILIRRKCQKAYIIGSECGMFANKLINPFVERSSILKETQNNFNTCQK